MKLAEAAHELAPLRQGELDGLCGLYSIINAVRLALYPRRLRKPEIKRLFETGLRVLSATRRLRFIVADGMYDDVYERMCAAVLADLALSHGEQLVLTDLLVEATADTTKDAHRAVRHAVHAGMPAIITLTRSYDHWSVIGRYSNARYYLFDSWGYRWVGITHVVLDSTEEEGSHGLSRALALRPG